MHRWSRPILRLLNRHSRLGSGSISSSPPAHTLEPLSSSSSLPPKSVPRRVFNGFLKFGSYSALATLAATAGVTYVYTVQELDEKTQRITDFTSLRVPGYDVHYEYEDLEKKTNSLSASAVPDHKDPPPPLEFKSPFIASAVTVFGEAIFLYLNVRCCIEELVKEYLAPRPDKLLPDPQRPDLFTLVLDLNETLVHSDWMAEFRSGEQTFKRPGFHAFLDRMNEYGYEVVLYTDECSLDVIPLCLSLRHRKSFCHVLTAGSITFEDGKHYRDLSKLNRDPARILYVSGHALENCLQPENCVVIKPWKKEVDDTTLIDLLTFLKFVAYEKPSDVRRAISVLKRFWNKDKPAQPGEEGTTGA